MRALHKRTREITAVHIINNHSITENITSQQKCFIVQCNFLKHNIETSTIFFLLYELDTNTNYKNFYK